MVNLISPLQHHFRFSIPELELRFYALIDNLNEEPLLLEDEVYEVEVDGYRLIEEMGQWLYDTVLTPMLPRMIFELSEGNEALLLDLLFGPVEDEVNHEAQDKVALFEDEEDLSDSEGMYYSVECHEEIPFNDVDEAIDLIESYPPQFRFLTDGTEILFEICDFWGAGEGTLSETDPVYSAIPTLILAGQYDPATPPDWSRATAERLDHSYYFEFPRAGHAILDAHPCSPIIIANFLDNPASQPEPDCLKQITIPPFD